jgi:hypothetical protein
MKPIIGIALLTGVAVLSHGAASAQGIGLPLDLRVDIEGYVLDPFQQNKIKLGYDLAPVPLNLEGKNQVKVGLGSYIVNAQGACNDCHTNPPFAVGGNPFNGEPKKINAANYLAGGTSFGPVTSRNITPDEKGLPAGLTLAQFIEVIRTGKDFKSLHPQISPLLQVMPWVVYKEMTDRDLESVYEYLSAIPHAEPAAKP